MLIQRIMRGWRHEHILASSGDTLRRVILFAPSAPAVQIFIPTMRAFDRNHVIVETETHRRFVAGCPGNRDD